MIEDYPLFADFWKLTNKIGRKELMAKRWYVLPQWKKIKFIIKHYPIKIKREQIFI